MSKKYYYPFIFMILLSVTLSGCAQLSDKFIPKEKEEESSIKRYQSVRLYDIRPNLELYTKRYIFWKNWHRELLAVLRNNNHKKIVVSIEQEISNLYDMKSMLVDEKGDELQVYIDRIAKVEAEVKKSKITRGNIVRVARNLENAGKQIKRKFSYTKVRGSIRHDFKGQQ